MLKFPAVLTHAVASGFFDTAEKEIASSAADVVVDVSALRQFDSSALAVLLECRRQALSAGKSFAVQGVPERLLQLAGVYGVAALIPATDAKLEPVAA